MLITQLYAIAIKDNNDLFLMFSITRSDQGDYYVNFNENYSGHKPHSSYHQSGQLHHKSHNKKVFPKRQSQPTANFSGSEVIITTSIKKGEGRAWNVQCEPKNYTNIMIIEDEILIPQFGYNFEVEIVEPGTNPWISSYPFAKIVQQQTFKTPGPWVIATLYQMTV